MARKRRAESGANISAALHARILELSELVWRGNRSQMGRDLDVDQSAMSKVLAGKQQPSAKLLEKLAAWPGINIGWLFRGDGEPLLEDGMRPGVGQFRPLIDELLPGAPEEHPDRLTGISYPVSAAFHSPTSYWYRLSRRSPVVASCPTVLEGDQMLIETGEKWTRRWGAVLGMYCAFRLGKGRRERVLLGKVDKIGNAYFYQYEIYKVNIFSEPADAWLIVADTPAGIEEGRRAVSGTCLLMEQVAGVCVLLVRPFARQRAEDRPRDGSGSA